MKTLIVLSVLGMLSFGIFNGIEGVNIETSSTANWSTSIANFDYENQAESKLTTQQQNLKDILQPSLSIVSIILISFIGIIALIWGLLSRKTTTKKVTNSGTTSKLTLIIFASLFSFQAIAQKIPINNASDLPQHFYNLEVTEAMQYIENDDLAVGLANKVEKQLLADLEKYDIQDKTTLKGYYYNLLACLTIKKDYKKALNYLSKAKALAEKPSEKYHDFLIYESFLLTTNQYETSNEIEFSKSLTANLSKLLQDAPSEAIKENLENTIGLFEIGGPNIIIGIVQGDLQPQIEKSKPKIPQSTVLRILNMKNVMVISLGYKPVYQPTFKNYYEKTYTIAPLVDIWEARKIVFKKPRKLKPIVISAWDSGVDIDVFSKENVWVNKAEKLDGKDNDGNGFIDDVNGIAYDLEANSVIELLMPAKKINPEIGQFVDYSKGFSDITAQVKSEEATRLKQKMISLKPKEVSPFLGNISLFGSYSHGTRVAGIMMADNPTAKMLTARITFNHKNIPNIPTIETAKLEATSSKNTIQYFKDNHVRVVNMSWGGSQGGIEDALAKNGVGENEAERKAMAKEIFDIMRNALYESMKNTPEILFVCAAGSSNNDVGFSDKMPSGFDLPNLIVVGAVDIEGKVTSFTTMGEGVDVYANGYEVESFIPGGTTQKWSGTSMASPQVANLAAKIWSRYPKLTVEAVKNAIINGATPSTENEAVLLIHPKKSLELVD
ncbi:MAG: tetratricopeptide (TPR) repeat protein [Cognaticolwellia sp.]|jgi:tetratricopeptide (TPR) repeat protein